RILRTFGGRPDHRPAERAARNSTADAFGAAGGQLQPGARGFTHGRHRTRMMAANLFDLTGKVAVVTGGTGAIGKGMCAGLAAAGATVVVLARDQAKITQTVDEIRQSGGTASGISADALDKAALQAASKRILSEHGRIDIVVNGAGGNKPEATAVPGQRNSCALPRDGLEWVFTLNCTSAVLASQVFGSALVAQNGGVIVNISAMASLKIMTRVVAYSAAKAAINNFTQWLAVYMAREHS